MSQYVTLTIRTSVFDEIINDLMLYCTNLDDYYDIKSCVELIDYLHNEYDFDINKRNKEFQQWEEYEKLFLERFKDGEFHSDGKHEYMNFNKVNEVIEDYKSAGSLDILDEKQQFFLVLDIINSIYKQGG